VTGDPLARLRDDAELRDLLDRYAQALDARDWSLWQSVFGEEVLLDLSDYEPDPPPEARPTARHLEYVKRLFAGFDATQHLIANARFTLEGARARGVAHMRAEHWVTTAQGGDRYSMFGRYHVECVRLPQGWRIERLKLELLREEGNRHVMRLAARRGRERLAQQQETI
jgi:3-phenylpropionate/cinnamic acid dioxygenase small subunit